MKKLARIIPLIMVAALVTGCTSFTTAPDGTKRTPLQLAEIAYVRGSIAYEGAMTTIQTLHDQGILGADLYARAYQAQSAVQKAVPLYTLLLQQWRATGTKPTGFDDAEKKASDAAMDIFAVVAEVKQ